MLAAPWKKGWVWVCVCTDVHTLRSSWLCPGHLCLHAMVIGAFRATLQVSWAPAPSVALSSGERLCVLLSVCLSWTACPSGSGIWGFLSFVLWRKCPWRKVFCPCRSLLTTPSQNHYEPRFPESERYKWACPALWGPWGLDGGQLSHLFAIQWTPANLLEGCGSRPLFWLGSFWYCDFTCNSEFSLS